MSKKERLVVIDGHALIHRAYHAIPPLTTNKGEVVNAVYGFTLILLNVLRELHPEYVVVAYDLPGKTKRHAEFAEYKANRKKRPEDLGPQIERTKDVIEAFNIPLMTKEGYEADDVIGTIVNSVPKEIESFIVTGDMDELQLVSPRTKVYTMRRGFTDTVIYDERKVKERYNLSPDQLVDYRALKGDPSDNIPGVGGVGEKTATDLIKEYGSLDKVYDNLDKIKPAVAEKLKKDKEKAYLSQKLSQIETGLSLDFKLPACCLAEYDKEKVISLLNELGFKSLFEKLPKSNGETKKDMPTAETKTSLIVTEKDLKALSGKIKKTQEIAIDTETTSQDPIKAKLVGISIALREKEAYYIPVGHKKGKQLSPKTLQDLLNPVFEDERIKKIGHNIKYDYIVLTRAGFDLSGIDFDTMIAAYLLDPNMRSQKLSTLATAELGIGMIDIESLIGTGKDQITFDEVSILDGAKYSGEDADVALRLKHLFEKKLKEVELLSLAQKIEFPLIPILSEMEISGIGVDKKKLQGLSKEADSKIKKLKKSIYSKAGKEFNISSPLKLQGVLYEKLKIQAKLEDPKDLKKLKSGGYSTAASELEKLKGAHPIIDEILTYRELSKLKSTYIDVLPNLLDDSGRVHTTFNQTVTQTGRLSSTDPNLQNIPIRTDFGKKIREAFIPNKGNVFVSADYSQIELRVIAHIARDQEMIKIFKEGRDIHTETAAKLYSVPMDRVEKNMRRAAKIVNFGIIYGVSAHGLHQQVGVTREEGQKLIDKYFEIHPEVKKYTEEIVERAKEIGYVETIFGRRRYLPEINSKNFSVRNSAERMAINMPVQGTAADLLKLAMIDIEKEIYSKFPGAKMLLQIHDELLFEVNKKEAEELAEFVKSKMNGVVKLLVPIETETHIAESWGEAK
ncbi:MAG: DNA polymerase I [Patescibacteria group bacterium]|nr:DNA polymerase I [Patescibacteria group bacterium]